MTIMRERNQLRLTETVEDSRIDSHELDQEARASRQQQVPPHQAAGRMRRLAHRPQYCKHAEIQNGFVNRRGMHSHAVEVSRHEAVVIVEFEHRLRPPADYCVRIGHRPRQGGRQAPVAIAGQLASHSADCLSDRERHPTHVQGHGEPDSIPARNEVGAEQSADHAAVEHESRAGKNHRLGIGQVGRQVVENRVDARADQAHHGGRDHDRRRIFGVEAAANAFEADNVVGRQEAERHHQAEAIDGQRAEVEQDRNHCWWNYSTRGPSTTTRGISRCGWRGLAALLL